MPRSAVAPAAPAERRRAHDLDVERALRVARLLAAVDHELLPHRPTRGVGARDRLGRAEAPAVALAHAHALERHERLRRQRAQLGHGGGDALAGAHGDDHQRHLRVGGEEARPPALAARGAVDAEQHGRARDAVAVQGVHDGDVRRPAVRTLAAPEVDGELGFLAHRGRRPRRRPCGRARAVMSPSPLSATTSSSSASMRAGVSTATETIGRSSESVSSRSVCRWCLTPKPATPRSTRLVRSCVAGVEIGQRVGQEAIAGAVALAEVGRQLQRVGHSAPPIWSPSHTQARPSARLTSDVGPSQPQTPVLAEAMGLEHPRAERRVGAEQPGAEEAQRVAAHAGAVQDARAPAPRSG